jgi:hypothetical protein
VEGGGKVVYSLLEGLSQVEVEEGRGEVVDEEVKVGPPGEGEVGEGGREVVYTLAEKPVGRKKIFKKEKKIKKKK